MKGQGQSEGDAGFTLVETLVALAILGMALVALFQSSRSSLELSGAANDRLLATVYARALLKSTLLQSEDLASEHSEAIAAGFQWQVVRTPFWDPRWPAQFKEQLGREVFIVEIVMELPSGGAVSFRIVDTSDTVRF